MHLFKNLDYVVLTVVTAVGGMLYYSLNGIAALAIERESQGTNIYIVIYPTMVEELFTTDIVYAGLLSCAIRGGVALGQFSGSCLFTLGGHFRWKIFAATACTLAFTAGLAGATTQSIASALATLDAIAIGMLESLAATAVTVVISDQKELGVAAGTFGSLCSLGGVLASKVSLARNFRITN